MVSGGDDCLMIAACYHDAHSKWRAGFNIRKLVQSPEGFGTGCIVQAASHPELSRSTARLLQTMGFTGIAEVEYKWDLAKKEYQLIEINPRPWDQHRLGNSCGVDLMYLAYCEHAGMQLPAFDPKPSGQKWIAEDTFVKDALCLGYRRDPKLRALFRMAKGRRVYAIWSAADPLPFLAYVVLHFLPELATMGMHFVRSVLLKRLRLGRRLVPEQPRYGCDQKGETRV
jgi:predicted ATP-grasp superfamily ATP-dependent carboligase